MIGVALAVLLVTFHPHILRSKAWRATVTPLASIIGSGFLVAGPLLGMTAGRWAVLAMAGLCAMAWLFGSAIRHNIAQVEPLLDADGDGKWDDSAPRWLPTMERLSDLALAFAYFISVAYYINLFAAFGLRLVDVQDRTSIVIVSCAVIGALGIIGTLRGLRWLENIELPAVGLKLALIAGLIAALALASTLRVAHGEPFFHPVQHLHGWHDLGILVGLVILVQGFETSRYLGIAYPAEMRIRTMRRAQLIATAIYLVFILLLTPYFKDALTNVYLSETAIIDLLQALGWAIAPLIILTALASQLSAAVADMNGAGGLINSASENRVSMKLAYAATAAVAIAITLSADIFQIIVYASKAFVVYYGLQSATAALLCVTGPKRRPLRAVAYGSGVLIAVIAVLFGVSAG